MLGLPGCLQGPGSASGKDEQRNQILGITCQSRVNVTGTVTRTADEAQPSDVFGCWPVGTWTFTTSLVSSTCPASPVLESQYSFQVMRDPVEGDESYTYLNSPNNPDVDVKVTSGGGGLCQGGVMIFSPDHKTLFNLKPTLQSDGVTLNGFGQVEVYETPQF
jgi:hypothetical protein